MTYRSASNNHIEGYKYLGFMNGWVMGRPKEFEDCIEAKHHDKWEETKDRSVKTTICHECKIYFQVDSSD